MKARLSNGHSSMVLAALDLATSDEAMTRAVGAPLIPGNRIRLLRDATENYPAWYAAIESAKRWIHFETYVIHEDETGRKFAELLCAKARDGVKVRLIYDWIGSLGNTYPGFWRSLSDSGVEVRCFNGPTLRSPFAWINRDHRKAIAVDGRIAFVTGLCLGQRWIGAADRGVDPWRDAGVQIEGPALADVERAFADSWAAAGPPLPTNEQPPALTIRPVGGVACRIVASVPNSGNMYRLDQLVAALARRSIWIADAYFAGTASYVQALCAAARSGVDVRLLLPGANDVPVMRAIARAGLRPLLEAGVRVFEWNGSMMHAKTAVADGIWARVGSTNLNLTSWLKNRELDVVVEDKGFAQDMERAYLDDLSRSTEIVLAESRPAPLFKIGRKVLAKRQPAPAGGARTAAGVMRLGRAVGSAITQQRELGATEAVIMTWAAILLIGLSAAAIYWPRAVAFPAAFVGFWFAVSLLARAHSVRSKIDRHGG